MTAVTHRPRTDLAPSRAVLGGVLVLAALSLAGAVISVSGGLSPTLPDAMGPHGRLSIPWPMTLAQVGLAVAAGSRRRPVALAGSALVAVALLAGVVSGFFDGGYTDDRLSRVERGFQAGFVCALVVVGAVAVGRFVRAARS